MGSVKRTTLGSLKAGRPPMAKSSRTMSRKASRFLINNHHQLEKRRLQAKAKGDKVEEALIEKELAKLGGLDHYQQASLQGQSQDRGGDTSKVLMDWLPLGAMKEAPEKFRLLEVGALSTRNACSMSGLFQTVHIDLNSQEPGIEQQDFMERPLPKGDWEKFDIISLSLVLNFVPDAATRGNMLQRTLSFLKRVCNDTNTSETDLPFPSVFMVLPRSCLDNSRYMSERRFEDIMNALGFSRVQRKMTQKLAYSLWVRVDSASEATPKFPKREVNPGRTRNNFVITLDGSAPDK